MNIAGTGAIDTPLDLDKIKPGSLKALNVLDSTRVNQQDPMINMDPIRPGFGLPEHYQISGEINLQNPPYKNIAF